MAWLAMFIVLHLQPSVVFETFPKILISSKIPDVLNEVLIQVPASLLSLFCVYISVFHLLSQSKVRAGSHAVRYEDLPGHLFESAFVRHNISITYART